MNFGRVGEGRCSLVRRNCHRIRRKMTHKLSNIGEKFGALYGRPVPGSFDRLELQVWKMASCLRVKRRAIAATIDHESGAP